MSGSKDNDSGLMSNAGLVRYFDSENRITPKIDPRTVLAVSVLIGMTILLVEAFLLV